MFEQSLSKRVGPQSCDYLPKLRVNRILHNLKYSEHIGHRNFLLVFATCLAFSLKQDSYS